MDIVQIECRSWRGMDGERCREAWVVSPGGESTALADSLKARRPVLVHVFDVLNRAGVSRIVERWNVAGEGRTTIELSASALEDAEGAA